jgi:nucleotide-binding universal stress UspA family protein
MIYKKMFFPIGGGEELKDRLFAALLIAKYFDANLEILRCIHDTGKNMYKSLGISAQVMKEIDEVIALRTKDESIEFENAIKEIGKIAGMEISTTPIPNKVHALLTVKEGNRSFLVEEESKFCDIVIAAAPPSGIATATFETSVLKSGKPVLMFPRKMKTFSTKSILIGWNNTVESSRAITSSIELLKLAEKVQIVSSDEYSGVDMHKINQLIDYLKFHDIDATYKIVETTRIPGEALLNAALDGNFDLIVAGAYGHKGLRELMFGGATRYLLEHSTLPIFMSH